MTRTLSRALLPTYCLALALVIPSLMTAQPKIVTSLSEQRQRHLVTQQWDLSCGAATLATVLKFQHGEDVTEREVAIGLMKREEYLKNPKLVQLRQGFSLLDMKRYLGQKGYQGIGLGKLTLPELVRRAPVIVPIQTRGYNHFVVFRGIHGNRVLLADPAWGNRTMRKERFRQAWIDFPQVGHVGFLVTDEPGHPAPPAALAPRREAFVFLR